MSFALIGLKGSTNQDVCFSGSFRELREMNIFAPE